MLDLMVTLDSIRISGGRRIRVTAVRSGSLSTLSRSRCTRRARGSLWWCLRLRLRLRTRCCHLRRPAWLLIRESVCGAGLLARELAVRRHGAIALCGTAVNDIDNALFLRDLLVAGVGVGGDDVLSIRMLAGRWRDAIRISKGVPKRAGDLAGNLNSRERC